MITNNDKPGNYCVWVYAIKNSVAGFQCPSWDDAVTEANRIRKERAQLHKPTSHAIVRVIARRGGRTLLGSPRRIEF
jgi:hypothetical protein